jgi:hypothetical protein
MPSFVEKYPKIKYVISAIGGKWTFVKLKILTDIKIRFKKKQAFSQSAL